MVAIGGFPGEQRSSRHSSTATPAHVKAAEQTWTAWYRVVSYSTRYDREATRYAIGAHEVAVMLAAIEDDPTMHLVKVELRDLESEV